MSILSNPLIWPSISEELEPFIKYCKGIVLNAGSGKRDIKLGNKDLGIDIVPDNNPDIIGNLHSIPLLDNSVDTIVSIAVLEHTRYPWVVAQEFYRVLRPGGHGIIAVPFLQPQHACPNDYVRFTEGGLIELMKYVGFEVVETAHVHHFGQTLAWQLWEYIQYNQPKKILQPLWMFFINQLSRGNILKGDSPNTRNTNYIVVLKGGEAVTQDESYLQVLKNEDSPTWFYPLLACPKTKQKLHLEGNVLVSEDSVLSYTIENGLVSLLPEQAKISL